MQILSIHIPEYLSFSLQSLTNSFKDFHATLPFSNMQFYVFIFLVVAVALLFKLKFRQNASKTYTALIFGISLLYIFLLFTKPFHIILFILYGYVLFRQLSQKRKAGGLKMIILYILPLFFMKLFNVLPEIKNITSLFQIAGISYATFKMIQVHYDEAENDDVSLISYFSFMAFPATLLIGPIDRYRRFRSDLDAGFSSLNSESFLAGCDYFIRGLLYKYILATAIHDLVLEHLGQLHGLGYHLAYMYSYLFYLFFDFAGYSLLAMGFGHMLGIKVPYNFRLPFLAENPKEFWHRWHKTLGDWLNDYFFKPIFKHFTTKKTFKTSIQRQSAALLLTFTLMGFWNGFELHFILSGVLFGLYSVVHNYYSYQCKKQGRDIVFGKLNPVAVRYLSIFIFFHAVAFSIYIFSGKLI
ncbi:MAG: hypothetical protein K0R65_576 [Crocinitomicaceae bacterium]|jgi:membrane protein involved in D-alanine export|nr:hypothetical protein [Crocinitomicaceae bacterium]